MHDLDIEIHTRIPKKSYHNLKKYGNTLKDGIEEVLKIAEGKTNKIHTSCFSCKQWNKITEQCKLIHHTPTVTSHCEFFKRP